MGNSRLVSGTRESVLSGIPYMLVHRIKDKVAGILSFRDGRMQFPPTA